MSTLPLTTDNTHSCRFSCATNAFPTRSPPLPPYSIYSLGHDNRDAFVTGPPFVATRIQRSSFDKASHLSSRGDCGFLACLIILTAHNSNLAVDQSIIVQRSALSCRNTLLWFRCDLHALGTPGPIHVPDAFPHCFGMAHPPATIPAQCNPATRLTVSASPSFSLYY